MKHSKSNLLLSGLTLALALGASIVDAHERKSRKSEREGLEAELLKAQKSHFNTIHESRKSTAATTGAIGKIGVAIAAEPQIAIGRIVHFVLESGVHRPAIITENLENRASGDGPVALTVFPSLLDQLGSTLTKCVVHYDSTKTKPGTWHWPERQ